MALAESWAKNWQHGAVAKARKFVVVLAAQSVNGVGSKWGVSVVGLSAANRFLAYLLI